MFRARNEADPFRNSGEQSLRLDENSRAILRLGCRHACGNVAHFWRAITGTLMVVERLAVAPRLSTSRDERQSFLRVVTSNPAM